MLTYYISKERFWIVVNGGGSKYNQSKNSFLSITGSNITMIIELGVIINVHVTYYHYHVHWNFNYLSISLLT